MESDVSHHSPIFMCYIKESIIRCMQYMKETHTTSCSYRYTSNEDMKSILLLNHKVSTYISRTNMKISLCV